MQKDVEKLVQPLTGCITNEKNVIWNYADFTVTYFSISRALQLYSMIECKRKMKYLLNSAFWLFEGINGD